MSIRTRLSLVIVFSLLIPPLLTLISLFIYIEPFKSKTVDDVQNAPGWIIPPLQEILDAQNRNEINENEVILAVILGDEGFIYTNSTVRDVVLPQLNNWSKDIGEFQDLTHWNRIAISAFTYKGKAGMVFYRQNISAYLSLIGNDMKGIIIFISMFIILMLIVTASMFLLSLRRKLYSLVTVANKIGEGDMNFTIPIPRDTDLAPLFLSFDKLKKQLIENQAQKSRFLMAISHDLKTPLTSIKGYLEAFADGMVDSEDDREKYLSIISNKTNILEQRIIELIDFAQMETINWQGKFSPLDISALLKEISGLFALEAEIHNKQFSFHINLNKKTLIQGDRQLLMRAFENLFDNAIRYTDKKTNIELKADQENNQIIISIADSGTGISESDQPYIFEAFYRGSRARNEKGMGLGLSSVKSIFEIHQGKIKYEQSPMGGSQFTIHLPVLNGQ